MSEKQEQWYTNKDLFEQTQQLRDELKFTQIAIKKYNGLHEKLDSIEESLDEQIKRCDEVQTSAKTKSGIYDRILQLWPIIISTIIFIFSRL